MKPFLLSVGRSAGRALPTILASLSAGIALPVRDLDILEITDSPSDLPVSSLAEDMNLLCRFFSGGGSSRLFPSSFRVSSDTVRLPSLRDIAAEPASEALLAVLRGRGIPLSFRTDGAAGPIASAKRFLPASRSVSAYFLTFARRFPPEPRWFFCAVFARSAQKGTDGSRCWRWRKRLPR